ncbi:MAG: CRISPR-associated endoribonuclease Cas6 [Prolixibacteraceae bacterium]
MRIHLKVTSTNQVIPFDHQPLLTGTIHKWLGWNDEHGNVSLYSFSRLEGGKLTPEGLQFERGASFFFSAFSPDMIRKIIDGIRDEPDMFYGLKISEILLQEIPDFSNRELFFPASPIFIKRRVSNQIEHILFDDPRASSFLKETLQTKMDKAGITDDSFEINFEINHSRSGTKKINYNGIQNRASWCPVSIKGKPEIKLFAWNVGLGNSTGIGFGAIK